MTRPSPSVLALGYAGLLPPLAGIAARLSGSVPPDAPVVGLLLLGGLLYGGLILSFLGGMWWGAACAARRGAALRPWLTLAVMPSLIALAALMAGVHAPRVAGALLAIALVASLLVDRKLVQNDMVPDWWMVLRVPLSLGLAAEMVALAFVL
jgi:hypothetical protein